MSGGRALSGTVPGVVRQLRAAFVLFHVAAVIVLALPGTHRMQDPTYWNARHTRREMDRWADTLADLGVDVDRASFRAGLRVLADRYAETYDALRAPFLPYARAVHLWQGWKMFSSPQTDPAEVRIEIDEGDGFRPVFVERSAAHRWNAHQLDHNRIRKLFGRLGRSTERGRWYELTTWAARRLARDFPDARQARFSIRRWRSPPPEAVRRGAWPEGEIDDVRVVSLDRWR